MKLSRSYRLSLCGAALASIAILPARAEAHLNATGMGPLYDGMAHFLTSPLDIVPAVAIALIVGMRGARYARVAMFTVPIAWLIGGLLGLGVSTTNGSNFVSAIWFLMLGGLLAADFELPIFAIALLSAVVGFYHGVVNGAGMAPPSTAIIALVGLSSAVFVVMTLVSAFVTTIHAEWARIAVRVSGSWIAASGILMLGWALR